MRGDMLEGVAERKERKRDILLRKRRDRGERAFHVGHDIPVREHHPFGLPVVPLVYMMVVVSFGGAF